MKKLLLSFVVLPGALAIAQVGINTDAPEATLDIRAKEDQKGDLRIEGVKEKSTQWLLVWDEEDQKVKRTSLTDLKWDIIVDKGKINYIRGKQPKRADEIIKKIKQCAPENIVFDKLFGVSGKHDFVYCATFVSGDGYSRTWLNLNLGAEYANINSLHFNPTFSETGEKAHGDENLYGSLYQWQRASDGHEFRDSETTTELADTWTETSKAAGKFIIPSSDVEEHWIKDGDTTTNLEDTKLWQAGGVNNPCPSGYHVPTYLEWIPFYQVLMGGDGDDYITEDSTNKMWVQTKLPNLAAAGYRKRDDGLSYSIRKKDTPGNYWSSSDVVGPGTGQALRISFSSEHSLVHDYYTPYYFGASVRCIKDDN